MPRSPLIILCLIVLTLCGCAVSPRAYVSGRLDAGTVKRVAILPFENLSGQQDAGRKIEHLFLVELMSAGGYLVAEPGEVDRVLMQNRIRATTRVPFSALKTIGEELNVEFILLGTVLEYRSYGAPGGEIPSVAIAARMTEVNSGDIVWSSHHSRKGDDSETVFGMGRVTSLEALAQNTVSGIVKTLKR
jgi:TolB-like protein